MSGVTYHLCACRPALTGRACRPVPRRPERTLADPARPSSGCCSWWPPLCLGRDHDRHRRRRCSARRRRSSATSRSGEFLGGTRWAPNDTSNPGFGVLPLVTATFVITVIALLVAVPLGLGAAMYLSEYASPKTAAPAQADRRAAGRHPVRRLRLLRADLRHPDLLQEVLHIDVGFTNVLAAGLVLGVMIIPTIASLSEDAMSAVPLALRQGSLRHGGQPDADHAAGGASRPRCPASPPRSSWACRGPSARR